jgi:hypothetical protein
MSLMHAEVGAHLVQDSEESPKPDAPRAEPSPELSAADS